MRQISTMLVLAFSVSLIGCAETPSQSSGVSVDVQRTGNTNESSAPLVDAAPNENEQDPFGDKFPEVLAVEAASTGNGSLRFNVTLSSTYDSPQRYADAWRVLDESDKELGIRILGHDHAGEQPFTRSHTIEIKDGTKVVFVEGRDQLNGWSGQRFKVELR